MTTFLLIRHADTDAVGSYIAGRSGLGLNLAGREQLEPLVARLRRQPIMGLYSSPLERTRVTAEPIARALGLSVQIAHELNELDFGDWTGRSFDELAPDPDWRLYNVFRSGTRMPGGEDMLQVQARAVGLVQRLREEQPGQVLALVTHGDIVRAILAYYLGLAMDLFTRIEISPASVSALGFDAAGPHVLYVNQT